MIKHYYLSPLLLLLSINYASAESFQDYLKKNQQDQTSSQFKQFSNQHLDEFQIYKKQLQDAFKLYKQKVAVVWGPSDVKVPTKKVDVSYREKLSQRSVIDYSSGKVTVDIIVTPAESKKPALIQKKMKKALHDTLTRGHDNRSIIDVAKKPSAAQTSGQSVLTGLIKGNDGQLINANNKNKFINQQSTKLSTKRVVGNDKQPRVIVSTSITMIPEHIKVRATKYKRLVKKYSKNMNVPTNVIYAIIETESAFNPNARSSVPAFGLMQLVPTSGARDAYRLLFKKDKVVSDKYLYNPENNIKLGTAFINKLYYGYLSGIANPESRTWAAIAGYNTGAGNVFTTFAGKYRRSKFGNRSKWKRTALDKINSKTPEEVYQYMRRNLPHKETQSYIKNIRNRTDKYNSL